MKVLVTFLAIASAAIWGYLIGTLEPRVYTDRNVVEAICEYSATVKDGSWEDACGLAQDVSGETFSGLVVKE